MKKGKPKFMILYRCNECGKDSGWTELDVPKCRFCDYETTLFEVSKKEITAEVMAERMRTLADSIMNNLRSAYESMSEEDKKSNDPNFDPEKEMLLLLEKAKKFREDIHKLELKDPEKKPAKSKKKK